MNGLNLLSVAGSACACLEIGQSSIEALSGEAGLELPLERGPGGRLTGPCKERLILRLSDFLKGQVWRGRPRVLCAIGARGVALRRLTLPTAAKEDLRRLLSLQIESEFPLPPDELAWGYQPLGESPRPANGHNGNQDFLVVAVKKDVVEDYAELLSACGVTPVFTLAALARNYLCPQSTGDYALLDVGRDQSELVVIENGIPASLRVLPWGGESITGTIAEKTPLSRDEAEKFKLSRGQTATGDGESGRGVPAAWETTTESLAGAVNGLGKARKLFVSGKAAGQKGFAQELSRRLPPGTSLEPLNTTFGEGRSAAVLGLRRAAANGGVTPLLTVQLKPTNGAATTTRPTPWKWIALAVLPALGLAALPYLEAIALKPLLEKRLAALKADKSRLPIIDQKWNFLQHLKENQPPYLDAMFLMAKSAPPGAHIDSLSLNRRGELSLRGTLQNSTQVAEFRSKLIDSGFFASVIVDEQAPAPAAGGPKLSIRLTAQWKPLSARQTLALAPTKEEIEKAKTRDRSQMGAGGPGMMPPMMPPTMPSGMGGRYGPGMMPGGIGGPGKPDMMPPGGSGPAGAGGMPSRRSMPGSMPGGLPPGVVIPGMPMPPNQ